jgi:hypothetical protein
MTPLLKIDVISCDNCEYATLCACEKRMRRISKDENREFLDIFFFMTRTENDRQYETVQALTRKFDYK